MYAGSLGDEEGPADVVDLRFGDVVGAGQGLLQRGLVAGGHLDTS